MTRFWRGLACSSRQMSHLLERRDCNVAASQHLFFHNNKNQVSRFINTNTIDANNIDKNDSENESSSKSPATKVISIDRSSLRSPVAHEHNDENDSPMLKHLKTIVRFRGGPISVAEYMEEVLTNPNVGFYMNRDVFGSDGDFVTSPDVSQMFGELIGVWCMCLWEQMGQPKSINVIELGPGRGTLMADLLRSTAKFQEFSKSISVHFVECSPALRELQHKTLSCTKHETGELEKESEVFSSFSGSRVSWHSDILQVPNGVPSIIIAHEFFDALPVHQFQKTTRGWCEKLIDIDDDTGGLRFVLSRESLSKLFLSKRLQGLSSKDLEAFDHIEVSPETADVTKNITERIASDGGAALIIDYGQDGIISDSLQAIRKHKFVGILDEPGTADLSAYVDFAYIRKTVEETNAEALAYGPITQSRLLGSLGINFRAEALLKVANDEQAEALKVGYWKLVGEGPAPFWEGKDEEAPVGMGNSYKAMAIVNKSLGTPVCFEQ